MKRNQQPIDYKTKFVFIFKEKKRKYVRLKGGLEEVFI